MSASVFRYSFDSTVALEEVEATFVLAAWGAEALHGEAQVRLDAGHLFDRSHRVCVIDATTDVGRDLNRLFAGYVTREFGATGFQVERLPSTPAESA